MSMKIERSSLDQVRQRFELNKKKREEKKKEYDIEERLKEIKEEVCGFVMGRMFVFKTYSCGKGDFLLTHSGLLMR